MRILIVAIIWTLVAPTAFGDTGGPYEFVPDLQPGETPPVCAIPVTSHPLEFYLTHFPEFKWDKKLNEPTSFTWKETKEYYAAPSDLNPMPYTQVVAIRYISQKRLEQGLLHADAVLILASQSKGKDYVPVYFTFEGPSVYNHRVSQSAEEKTISVFRDYSGTGAFTDEVKLVSTEKGFARIQKR